MSKKRAKRHINSYTQLIAHLLPWIRQEKFASKHLRWHACRQRVSRSTGDWLKTSALFPLPGRTNEIALQAIIVNYLFHYFIKMIWLVYVLFLILSREKVSCKAPWTTFLSCVWFKNFSPYGYLLAYRFRVYDAKCRLIDIYFIRLLPEITHLWNLSSKYIG